MPVGVLIGLGSALVAALVTEIYCHRALAHHAFQVHPTLGSVFTTYFWVFVGTDPETWAAVHRLHHRYADTPPDPHSPACALLSRSSPAPPTCSRWRSGGSRRAPHGPRGRSRSGAW